MSETNSNLPAAERIVVGKPPLSALDAEDLRRLPNLRVAGILTAIFPALLLLIVILGMVGYNDSGQDLLTTIMAILLGALCLSGFAGLAGMFFAIFSGDNLPNPWATVRVLVILAGIAEFLGPILVVVGFLGILSMTHF